MRPINLPLLTAAFVAALAYVSGFFSRRLYYQLKPLIPYRLRLLLRHFLAIRQRRENEHCWPILEEAGAAPQGWPGWPDGSEFAFVLTHDVESASGLARVKQLAELEMSMGFRSSFNFIPEGTYQVPDELIAWLLERGFEVGVHDHRHDGKLYESWEGFQQSAARINHFLKKWKAVGFRSGFMLRNLLWISELDLLYDSSTFDTDAFEPQPDGVHTIFPFWFSGPHDTGYVEMPYTLAQDSTLFLVLRERTSQIWQDKLAWVASRQGMGLMNIHPDYMAFHDEQFTWKEYPVSVYREFLEHVKRTYGGRYYHALPKEVAAYALKVTTANTDRPVHVTRSCRVEPPESVPERVIRFP